MQDLIKESASEFEKEFTFKGLENSLGWKYDDDDLIPDILDWHTKQMEKAIKYERERIEDILKANSWDETGKGDMLVDLKGILSLINTNIIMTNKDTNSQDSIQVGNEIIQTNTLGTTTEEVIKKWLENEKKDNYVDYTESGDLGSCVLDGRFDLEELVMQLLSQSKTDLLNALIDKIEGMKKDAVVGMTFEEVLDVDAFNAVYNKALDDTINHLKSLRDVARLWLRLNKK